MPSGPKQASRSANEAPVADETTITNLRVTGKLPAALSGQYIQIGPNRIAARSLDWAGGEGMVHAVSLDAGRAISYRNRWVKTDAVAQKLAVEPTPARALSATTSSPTTSSRSAAPSSLSAMGHSPTSSLPDSTPSGASISPAGAGASPQTPRSIPTPASSTSSPSPPFRPSCMSPCREVV